jgi:hypothetical protein
MGNALSHQIGPRIREIAQHAESSSDLRAAVKRREERMTKQRKSAMVRLLGVKVEGALAS